MIRQKRKNKQNNQQTTPFLTGGRQRVEYPLIGHDESKERSLFISKGYINFDDNVDDESFNYY